MKLDDIVFQVPTSSIKKITALMEKIYAMIQNTITFRIKLTLSLHRIFVTKTMPKKINSLFYPEILHPTPKGSHIEKEETNQDQFHEDELVFFWKLNTLWNFVTSCPILTELRFSELSHERWSSSSGAILNPRIFDTNTWTQTSPKIWHHKPQIHKYTNT